MYGDRPPLTSQRWRAFLIDHFMSAAAFIIFKTLQVVAYVRQLASSGLYRFATRTTASMPIDSKSSI